MSFKNDDEDLDNLHDDLLDDYLGNEDYGLGDPDEDVIIDDIEDGDFEPPEANKLKVTKPKKDVFGNDLEDFEEEEEEEDKEPSEEDFTLESDSDYIKAILKSKGIVDPEKILFQDDNGEVVEKNFYELDAEERLEILLSNDADINFGLNEEEIATVNFLRKNETNFSDVIDFVKRQAVEEYIRSTVSEEFSIDQMSDEELFVLDLKSKFEDLDEDELQFELDKQLENVDLFKKKMNKVRQDYVQLEAEKMDYDEQESLIIEEQRFEQLANSLIETAVNIPDIGGLDLSEDDKNEVLDFILNKDLNGVSPLVKSLDDHDTLFRMAWFALKGNEAFEILHDYYKKQIDQTRKASAPKPNAPVKQSSKMVVKPKSSNASRRGGDTLSIDDLYDNNI